MLNNATGFRKIYIAAGYTDLRHGIDGLASIIKFNFQLIHMKRTFFFSSAAGAVTASRGLYGKATDSFSSTKGWSLAVSAGPVQRRGTGDHAGTISGVDEGAGDHLQTSDPGSVSSGSPVKYCAKRRKSKIFSHSPSRTDWKLSTAEPYCIHSIMEYLPAASCRVDKYSEKLKKLVVFRLFRVFILW
mgnify:CR=1 FL=1